MEVFISSQVAFLEMFFTFQQKETCNSEKKLAYWVVTPGSREQTGGDPWTRNTQIQWRLSQWQSLRQYSPPGRPDQRSAPGSLSQNLWWRNIFSLRKINRVKAKEVLDCSWGWLLPQVVFGTANWWTIESSVYSGKTSKLSRKSFCNTSWEMLCMHSTAKA